MMFNNGHTLEVDVTESSELYYSVGVILGDGSVSKYKRNYVVSLTTSEIEFAEEFKLNLEGIGANPSICETSRGYYRTQAYSKEIYHLIKSIEIDEFLDTDERENLIEFVRGFYESEGHDRGKGRGLNIYNSEKKYLDFIRNILERLNVQSHFTTTQTQREKDVYVLYVPSGYKEKFLKVVDPIIKRCDRD